MAYDPEFGAWVREHFAGLGPIEIKRMFGGAGVYADGRIFALLDDGVVWLKADDVHSERLVAAGARQFSFPTKTGETMAMAYWSMPEAVMDDPDEAVAWARQSVEVAARKAPAKPRRKTGLKGPSRAGG
ncbi:TfoX/Sxy family protein [Brevundimonas sp. R86498]|uniref:TfoX/Sxy family protein n=1 Tax=Brevundimonas sp. R86498 TaxID=3093845 RepID=UPI0037C772EA